MSFKPLSLVTAIEANRISSGTPFIPLIILEVINAADGSVAETLYMARNPEAIVFDGQTYEPAAFDIQVKEIAGEAASVSLTVNDQTQTIKAYMEQYAGGLGSNVTFILVNADNLAQGAEIREFFQIVGASSSDYVHSFTLGADNVLSLAFPRRRQTRDFCQWRFKSEECGYTGPMTSCDLTLQGANGCAAHSNTLNFGGFPGISSNGLRYR
jgi:phage-related protein